MPLISTARTFAPVIALALGVVLTTTNAHAKVYATPENATREAFPGATLRKQTSYLTEEQAARITEVAGSAPSSRIVISWDASKDDRFVGTAYLETHLVRTLPETILVVVDPRARIVKVEILSFDEPEDYLPRTKWLEQFDGRELDPDLSLRKALRGITGATLSSRAIASAVRRVLATHSLLHPRPPGSEAEKPLPPMPPASPEPKTPPAPPERKSPAPAPTAPPPSGNPARSQTGNPAHSQSGPFSSRGSL